MGPMRSHFLWKARVRAMRLDRYLVFYHRELVRRFSNYRRLVKAQLRELPDDSDQANARYESETDE